MVQQQAERNQPLLRPAPGRFIAAEPGEASPLAYITSLDLLGRAAQMTARTGRQPKPAMLFCWIQVARTSEPVSRMRMTSLQAQGRLYDAADRLKTAVMGGAETELWYDYAGRKKKIDLRRGTRCAGMGFWQYGYNALSQLTTQKDARNCITTLNYDLAGRLSSKNYTLGNCGTAATSSVANYYDGTIY